MDNIIKEEILKALKYELEFDYDCGYRCVDGTDITVNIIDSKAKVDLSFIGEAPIFELLYENKDKLAELLLDEN